MSEVIIYGVNAIEYLPEAPPAPSGIKYNRPQLTGQQVSYRVGDDKWRLDNMPYNAAPTNPLYCQELIDFFTLKYDNAFGNRLRFTDINGNATITDDSSIAPDYSYRYIIDNLTGLSMDYCDTYLPNNIKWNDAIDGCLSHSAYGFDDYYLPNTNEAFSFINNEASFYNMNIWWAGGNRIQWSSNTQDVNPLAAYYYGTAKIMTVSTKTSNRNYIPIRQHF